MKKLAYLVLALVLALSMLSVASAEELPLAGKSIGNTIVYKGDVWCYLLAVAFEEQAKALGAEIVVDDGELNAEIQTRHIETYIANDVDVIFADPATMDGCTEAFKNAEEAGIPVFTYDSAPTFEGVITHTGWDNYDTGVIVCNYVADWVKENLDGKANIILIGNYASEHCMIREVGFEDTLAKRLAEDDTLEMEVVYKADCAGNRETGANAIMNYTDPFNVVVSVVDNGAWGAVSAIEARGLDAFVFCMGAYGDEPFCALYNDHEIYKAGLVVDPAAIARITLDSYIEYLANGEQKPEGATIEERTVNIPLYMADHTNVEEYYPFPNGYDAA